MNRRSFLATLAVTPLGKLLLKIAPKWFTPEPYTLDAKGANLSVRMAYHVLAKSVYNGDYIKVFCHPIQTLAIVGLYVNISVRTVAVDESPTLSKYPVTFMGREVVQDISIPENEIQFRDEKLIVGRIMNLAVPS